MVDEGAVEAEHKEGNDGAGEGADKGVVDEQQGLSNTARKYAGRQWRYKQLMARMHSSIYEQRRGKGLNP